MPSCLPGWEVSQVFQLSRMLRIGCPGCMSSTVEAVLLVLVDNLEIVVEILAILAVTYLAWNALMD